MHVKPIWYCRSDLDVGLWMQRPWSSWGNWSRKSKQSALSLNIPVLSIRTRFMSSGVLCILLLKDSALVYEVDLSSKSYFEAVIGV